MAITLYEWPGDVTDALADAAPPALRAWMDTLRDGLKPTAYRLEESPAPARFDVAKAASAALDRVNPYARSDLTLGLTVPEAMRFLHARGAALDKATAVAQRKIADLRKIDPSRFDFGINVTAIPPADHAVFVAVGRASLALADGARLVQQGLMEAKAAVSAIVNDLDFGGAARAKEKARFDRLNKTMDAALVNVDKKLNALIEATAHVWYSTAGARYTESGRKSLASTGVSASTPSGVKLIHAALRATLRALARLFFQSDHDAKSDATLALAWPKRTLETIEYANEVDHTADWAALSEMIFGERLLFRLDRMTPTLRGWKTNDGVTDAVVTQKSGVPVSFNGFNQLPARYAGERRAYASAMIARFASQAQRYMPALLRDTPRVHVWPYNVRGPIKTPGGHYHPAYSGTGATVTVYLRSYAPNAKNAAPLDAVQTLAHEMAHHLWATVLRPDQKALWEKTVRADVVDFDFARLLTYRTPAWPPPTPEGWQVLPLPADADLPDPDDYFAAYATTPLDAELAEYFTTNWPMLRQRWDTEAKEFTRNDGVAAYGPYNTVGDKYPLEIERMRYALRSAYLRRHGYAVSPWYYRVTPKGNYQTAVFLRRSENVTARAPTFDPGRGTFIPAKDTNTVFDVLDTLKVQDPVLYLQTRIASSVYEADYAKKGNSTAWRWMQGGEKEKPVYHLTWAAVEQAAKLQKAGGRPAESRAVPRYPVTTYGATNAEEAWCDAVGGMVAYGAQAVLEPVRALVYALLPTFRRNPSEPE